MDTPTLETFAAAARVAALETIADSVERDPPAGETEFADALRALLLCGVQGIEIARMLGVESSCITRWTKKGSTPHPTGRRVYAPHLARIARRQVEVLRTDHGLAAPLPEMAEAA